MWTGDVAACRLGARGLGGDGEQVVLEHHRLVRSAVPKPARFRVWACDELPRGGAPELAQLHRDDVRIDAGDTRRQAAFQAPPDRAIDLLPARDGLAQPAGVD